MCLNMPVGAGRIEWIPYLITKVQYTPHHLESDALPTDFSLVNIRHPTTEAVQPQLADSVDDHRGRQPSPLPDQIKQDPTEQVVIRHPFIDKLRGEKVRFVSGTTGRGRIHTDCNNVRTCPRL